MVSWEVMWEAGWSGGHVLELCSQLGELGKELYTNDIDLL